jgi:CheY-like chemotaxis protein
MKRKGNVLVVDDEKTVCSSCRKILTREGYNVDVASSGKEALAKVKANGFDVVVTDWKMPEIEVILITGYPSVETSIEAIRSGVSDYVPKPFTPQELSDALIRALEKGQAVPADLVLDRLIEKGVVSPKALPQAVERVEEEVKPRPAVTPVPVEEPKVGPIKYVFKSVLGPVFGRLFFIALGPIVIYALFAGIVKAVMGKKALD